MTRDPHDPTRTGRVMISLSRVLTRINPDNFDYPNLFRAKPPDIRNFITNLIIMSIDLTEQATPPTRHRKALRSEIFTKDLFEERNLPPDNGKAKTHHFRR